ncbi:hypothetical protein [Pararhizobium sp. IMCC21322]|uniref:hypothetical protein n=1 Tax=Pararhizobium sp. IMCC21322 TaxID=3067903 RepID=UPI0027406C19|nr:hypothetical protein [Pararhizobium sp. IMCC21322]
MFNSTDVFNELISKGLKPVGRVVENPDKENSFLVFLRTSYDNDGRPHLSKRLISSIVGNFERENITLIITFLDEKALELDAAVTAMLSSKFPEAVVNSIVSLENGEGLVSIDLSDQALDTDTVTIEQTIREFLGFLGVEKLEFIFSTPLPLSTVTACIGMVRKHAPITAEDLTQKLVDAGFAKPSATWLNSTLDRWRKDGFLHRRTDKRFILTLAGLKHVGTRRNRTSPDISRALAIGRLA